MRHHRVCAWSFRCGMDRHRKREAGKIQQLRYISDLDAQAAQWGVENYAPDVGRPAKPEAVKAQDRFSALSRGPETLVLYRRRPIPRWRVGSRGRAGRVRYSCLKEAADEEAFMQIQ